MLSIALEGSEKIDGFENISQKMSSSAYDAEQDIAITKVSPVFSDSDKSVNFQRNFH